MLKSFFVLLISFCALCNAAIAGGLDRNLSILAQQQDPVEVHWYNTRDSVFELSKASELRGLAELVNTGIDFYQQEVRLANDIFLNDTTGWRNWELGSSEGLEQWIPIGKEDRPFSGTFDGQGHTIYGLYINRGMDSYYQGLFGLVLDGHIQHVHLRASFIRAHDHVGGIAGMIGYTSEIRDCTVQGRIIGRGHMVGGIVGKAEEYNRIIGCGNMGDVYGLRRVGGIAGSFEYGEIYNCFNRGHITGRHEEVGGLVGVFLGRRPQNVSHNFEFAKGVVREVEKRRKLQSRELRYGFANNYNIGEITGEYKVGGLTGSFMGLDGEVNDSSQKNFDILEVIGIRQLTANTIRNASKRRMYYANCYNVGKINARYPVHTDGLIGHYGWNWQDAVYLLDERLANSYWSDSAVVITKVETSNLPRDIRSFDLFQDIYSVRPPKGFSEMPDEQMRSDTFIEELNHWVEEQGEVFHRWRPDDEHVNGGYPLFEPEGGQP